MEKLNYSTGVKEFEVAGGTIRFNPADNAFVHRLFDCFEKLSQRQDEGEKENEELAADGEKLFEAIEDKEVEMRNCIEEVFGKGSAKKIFPDTGLYALADGLPVWTNFLLAVIDLVDASVADEQKNANPRIDFYMKKYGKYMKR